MSTRANLLPVCLASAVGVCLYATDAKAPAAAPDPIARIQKQAEAARKQKRLYPRASQSHPSKDRVSRHFQDVPFREWNWKASTISFISSTKRKSRGFFPSTSPATRKNYFQRALFRRVSKRVVRLHNVVHREAVRDELARLQFARTHYFQQHRCRHRVHQPRSD